MTDSENGVLLDVNHLGVSFKTDQGEVRVVDDVSFQLKAGQVLGLAGESGCGKSVTALSLIRLLPRPVAAIQEGSVIFKGENLLDLPVDSMRRIRGRQISMIFQEPMTALNPVHPVGRQITEIYTLHSEGMAPHEREAAAVEMLEKVGISDAGRVMKKYPHQLSGGMRQRVMIAMALACEPDILIADEPTTALDVTVQAQIMDLIFEFQGRTGMAVILITHDLGLIAENCDEVVVMYAGRVAEAAGVKDLFRQPLHPYTKGLLKSIPSRAQIAKTRLPTISGNVPSLAEMPSGCRFYPRCSHSVDICKTQSAQLCKVGTNHYAACHMADSI